MTLPSASYLKVPYDLRPRKQIERRMLIDAFQILAANGFSIRDYQYTGLGSIYFVDFIMLHKLLGVQRLLSVEYDRRITKRVRYNKPFAHVNIEMAPVGDVIPNLDPEAKHILWLDYDMRLTRSVVSDASLASYRLSPGSILLVTIDIEPPEGLARDSGPAAWRAYYGDQAGQFFGAGWRDSDFAKTLLGQRNADMLFNAIEHGVNGRRNIRFIPLFNFVYADGHAMLTVGGMIGTLQDERKIRTCDFTNSPFMRFSRNESSFEIRVPPLTRRERILLDHHMPCKDKWLPDEFEIEWSDVQAYRDVYRYYPAYAELLL